MSEKNIRIPLDLNSDEQQVRIKLEQDFDSLDVLSLKITSQDVYPKSCSTFGVVIGRVSLNQGFGVQNAKVSVFIPITEDDKLRNEIVELYPFESINDTYPNGVRYNLLPRVRNENNPSHRAVGNFPHITDFVHYPQYVEIMEKYYKYTTTTNDAGDFMIYGVPVGSHNIIMDFDVFDTTSMDLTANDLVEQTTMSGSIESLTALINSSADETEETINANKVPNFIYLGNNNYEVDVKVNIDEMPNIFHENKQIIVSPFWGDSGVCDVGITRCDFKINFKYTPTAVFFGFIHTPTPGFVIKNDYTISNNQLEINGYDKNAQKVSGDIYPMAEMEIVVYRLDDDLTLGSRKRLGVFKASRYNGVFKLTLPMYMDYHITDEFGSLVPTNNTKNGLPIKGYYAFEIYDALDSWNGRRVLWGGYTNPILAGIRIPSTSSGDLYLGGWEGTWNGLFEYDLLNRRRNFYTIKTTHKKHGIGNVLTTGDDIAYFPTFNTGKADTPWNFPINRDDLISIDEPYIIGSILLPRFETILTDDNEFKMPDQLLSLPFLSEDETYNEWVQGYEYFMGLGVKKDGGRNLGEVYLDLYGSTEYLVGDDNIFGELETWNFGDNSTTFFTSSLYALEMAKRNGSNANGFGVHKPYNQVVYPNQTFGVFVNSYQSGNINKQSLLSVTLYNITEELPSLINDGVYSSYNKNTKAISTSNDNEQVSYNFSDTETEPTEIYVDNPTIIDGSEVNANVYKNTYNGKFYYFGLYQNANALYHIENFYFVK